MKALILIIFISPYVFSQQSYIDSIEILRVQHTGELINPEAKVLTDEEIDHFQGLDYFSTSTNYLLTGRFEKNKGKKFKMPTSTERLPIYRRYGYVYFELNGETHRLTVYQNMELIKKEEFKNYLFVPFRDATSGIETYGGGRYLDIQIPIGTSTTIDFNLAYNPYCAYSYRYSCPVPPEENRLKIRIEAGEKIPLGH